jgi:hypothetical protein
MGTSELRPGASVDTTPPAPGPVPPGHVWLGDSSHFRFHYRAGVFLATRHLRRHAEPILETPLDELPHLSKRMIAFALRVYPKFLDRADMEFPIIVAGRGWSQIALDGRHRIAKAIWTGRPSLPTVRVPWGLAIEILIPPVYTAEWVYLAARDELRRAGHRLHHPAPPHGPAAAPADAASVDPNSPRPPPT